MSYHYLASNPSLQSVRFFLQTRFRCKVAPPSRHSLALRAHRHRLSAVARKKMCALARREMSRRARSLEKNLLGVASTVLACACPPGKQLTKLWAVPVCSDPGKAVTAPASYGQICVRRLLPTARRDAV